MTTINKTKTNARLRLAAANAAAVLAQDQAKPTLASVMRDRAEALRRLEAIIAEGETSIAELEPILGLLEGHAMHLLEDVIGCIGHVQCGGRGDWFGMLRYIPGELRNPRRQYQPGRAEAIPYLPLA